MARSGSRHIQDSQSTLQGKMGVRILKKRIVVYALLTVFLDLNCGVSNARQDCLQSLDETEFPQNPCLFLAVVSADPNSQSSVGKSFTNVMLLNCAVNIQERAACNRKSNLPYPTLRN